MNDTLAPQRAEVTTPENDTGQTLVQRFIATRAQSETFCQPLSTEDYGLQAEVFTSPPKWHLAHTSWFFETFILKPYMARYVSPDESYEVLFNSYYNGVGEQFPRARRGLLSRPSVAEVLDYRRFVNDAMLALLADETHRDRASILERCTLGIAHEQQHQELFFTDLKYSLAVNPLNPVYVPTSAGHVDVPEEPLKWLSYQGGLVDVGFQGEGFCFDNELPRHKTFLEPYMLANRLVTNREYQAFIEDGGYQRPELWLADGWATVQAQNWRAPHYWQDVDGQPFEYTLHGLLPRKQQQPVCHISGYEAEAFARWANARLPTEMEWEFSAANVAPTAPGVDDQCYQPQPAAAGQGLLQLYDTCWQWTQSAYSPYPGFNSASGAIGEYNGKFMSNQWVLRGGSCVSKTEHLRPSYRNFFYPQDRWQFTGIRLARTKA